jgi:hypothetical protein
MGRNQTEFGEVGAKAVGEVAVEKNIANWGDGKPVHTDTRYEKASLPRQNGLAQENEQRKAKGGWEETAGGIRGLSGA